MMVCSFRGVVASLALLPAIGVAQQAAGSGRQIAIDEAVRLAIQNQPATVQARNALRTGSSSVRLNLMQMLPNLNLNYSAGQQGGTQFIQGTPVPISGLPWTYTRGISTGMTLFDGGRNWYNYKSAESTLDASDATEVSQRYSIALLVKTQYYNVLAAREQEAAAQRQLEQNQQQLTVSAAKMAAGAATRADSLSAAIGVGTARLAILTARNNLANANAALTRFVASPVTVTALASDTADMARVDIDESTLSQMVLEGPAVKQAAAALVAAKATHKSATTPYYPTVSAAASYGQNPKATQGFEWGGGPTTTSTRLTFTAAYPLFNNYSRENSLIIARVAEDNAGVSLRDAKFGAQQNLTSFLSNYQTAQQSIELNQLQIVSALENLRVVTQQYNLGTKQLLDVLTAQASLDLARSNLISARLNARVAKANIEALIGRDIK